jgi:carboxypeptidase D
MLGSCYVFWALLAVSYVSGAPQDGKLLSFSHSCNYYNVRVVPSAASFYIPSIPDIHQDPAHPLQLFGGQLSADPNITGSQAVSSHLFFVMVKNRRTADRQRLMFWFNVTAASSSFRELY